MATKTSVDRGWFRGRMARRGLNQQDVAAGIGMHHTAFSKILLGQRKVKADEVRKIAKLLDEPEGSVLEHLAMHSVSSNPTEDGSLKLVGSADEVGAHEGAELKETDVRGFEEMPQAELADGKAKPKHPGFGFMKGMIIFPDDFDPAEPSFPDWEEYEKQKYGENRKFEK